MFLLGNISLPPTIGFFWAKAAVEIQRAISAKRLIRAKDISIIILSGCRPHRPAHSPRSTAHGGGRIACHLQPEATHPMSRASRIGDHEQFATLEPAAHTAGAVEDGAARSRWPAPPRP